VLTSTILTLITAVKFANIGIEARLTGQKGIGLFAKNDFVTLGWTPVEERPYEEQPLFTIDSPMVQSTNKPSTRSFLLSRQPSCMHSNAFLCYRQSVAAACSICFASLTPASPGTPLPATPSSPWSTHPAHPTFGSRAIATPEVLFSSSTTGSFAQARNSASHTPRAWHA
jgi:hypothetical protein